MSDIERDIGRMETELQNVTKLLDEVRVDLREIKQELAEMRGSGRVIVYIAGTIGAAFSLFGSWIVQAVFHK